MFMLMLYLDFDHWSPAR